MAARKIKVLHDDRTRLKIRTSQLLNRLHAYALSETDPQSGKPVDLSATQVKAIEVLLRKSLPDLSQTESTNTNINYDASEMTDAQLASIAAAASNAATGSAGVAEETEVENEPHPVH
jgi:hypothetical protein